MKRLFRYDLRFLVVCGFSEALKKEDSASSRTVGEEL